MKPSLFVLGFLAFWHVTPEATAQIDVLEHVQFSSEGETLDAAARFPSVEIDATVVATWNEDTFLVALASHLGTIAPGSPLEERIQILQRGVHEFLETQSLLLETKAVTLRWLDAGQPITGSVWQEFQDVNDRFGKADQRAIAGLKPFETIASSDADRAALQSIQDAFLGGRQDDFAAVAGVLEAELARLTEDLSKRIAEGRQVEVQMWASIYDSAGNARQLHIEGYDDLMNGPPIPSPRFQFSIDGRTRGELAAAEELGKTVKAIRDGTLQEDLRNAAKVVEGAARSLRDAIQADVLRANLDALEAKILEHASGSAKPLLDAVRRVRGLVSALGGTGMSLETEGNGQDLIRLATQMELAVQGLLDELANLRESIPVLLEAIRIDSNGQLQQAKDDLKAVLDQSLSKLLLDPAIAKVREAWRSIAKSFGLKRRLIDAANATGQLPRRVAHGESLDTRLVLLGAGEQHAGDTVVVSIQVRVKEEGDDGAMRAVSTAQRAMKLRWFGFHSNARGALIFADPRTGGFGGQEWEAAPSVVYVIHYGLNSNSGFANFWNDWFYPGVGVSLSLLDFEDGRDFELGAAATLTIFNDLLWVGYGRNIQAEADYFFVGINPLMLGDLYRQGGFGSGGY